MSNVKFNKFDPDGKIRKSFESDVLAHFLESLGNQQAAELATSLYFKAHDEAVEKIHNEILYGITEE